MSTGIRPGEDKNEIIAHEWTSLRTIWEACKSKVDQNVASDIDALFPPEPKWTSDPEDWHRLNSAEQKVGLLLQEPVLGVEYKRLLEIARSRKSPALAMHEANLTLFDADPDGTLDKKRAAYLALLDDLQRGFVTARFYRRLRRETARRLLFLGIASVGVAILPFAIYFIVFWWKYSADGLAIDSTANGHQLFSSIPMFGLVVVSVFGILGAFFSRVIKFQGELATIGFEEVMNVYQSRMLYVRLLYGMIGAIIFYFLLRSGLLGGSAFPDLSKVSVGEHMVWKFNPTGSVPQPETGKLDPSGLTILMPTPDFAKLVVWSFLAGFSERLVPDSLERAQGLATAEKTQ
jgi:hypothetical protein